MASKQKLEEGLEEIPLFSDEHKEDHQILNELDALLNALVDIVNNNQDNNEMSKSFENVSDAMCEWLDFHEQHLKHEEMIMAPLMKGIASNKMEKIKIARTLLDVNIDLTIKYQFGYVLKQLMTMKSWYCPMTNHKYEGIEIVIVYIHCFKMMSQSQKEYQMFVDIAAKTINNETWKQLLEYGLDKK